MQNDVPGGEFPRFVYASVIACFAWLLLTAWISFGRNTETDLDLAVAMVITFVLAMLPLLVRTTANRHMSGLPHRYKHFATSQVDTGSGRLSGGEAWIQMILPPAALALAATLIGLVHLLVG